MLPFTKRPGRGEESDVVVKDEIASKASVPPPASSSRPNTMRPPAAPASARSGDAFDDERTGLVQSRNLQNSPYSAPIPAAGRPISIPPAARSSRANGPGSGSIPPPARSVRPAAGSPASMRPPPSSARASFESDDEDAEDEDGGRTVVRPEGGGKIVRRTNSMTPAPRSTPSSNPTSISPAAVIRKTMESHRASRGANLVSGPPPELRGDLDNDNDSDGDEYRNDEFTQAAPVRASHGSGARSYAPPPASYEGPPSHRRDDDERRDEPSYRRRPADSMADDDSYAARSAPISSPAVSSRSSMMHSQPPPSSARPGHFSNPPPSNPVSTFPSAHNPVNPYQNTVPSGHMSSPPPQHMSVPPPQHMSVPPPGMMPAHFRMAQTGAIHGVMAAAQVDPPGTAVTSNTRVSGRPAMSWAAALAACGVFVGVVAVAILQRTDSAPDTQAAFVDPAHTAKVPGASDPNAPATPGATQPATQPLPPGLIGASPVPAQPPAAPPVLPGMMDPQINVAPPATQAPPATTAQTQPTAQPTGTFPAVAIKKPQTQGPRIARGGGGKASGDDDDDGVKSTSSGPKTTTSKGGGGKGVKSEADEEQRRALEELRKAQLEQSLGGK